MQKLQRGFSLVELAIVLVIIGLITGGILTGQDLIHASELNSVYADVNKYKTAANTFRLKYNGVPGDLKNATNYWGAETCPGAVGAGATGTCNGDGNGNIAWVSWNSTSTNEHYHAWEQLSLSGLIPGSYTGVPATATVSTSIVLGSNMPQHALNGFLAMMYQAGTAMFSLSGNAITVNGNTAATAGLTPIDASSIDSKYDDGRPGTGLMTTATATQNPGCATTDVASTAAYTLTGTTTTCTGVFWMSK